MVSQIVDRTCIFWCDLRYAFRKDILEIMLKHILSGWVMIFCLGFMSFGQNCDAVPDGKSKKILEQSEDRKKYTSDERIDMLEKAIEQDPQCMPCMLKLGEALFLRAKRGGSFDRAKQVFLQLKEQCANYHSEQYYFLGAMQYADREYAEAIKSFDAFLRFPDDDPSKFEKDYQKKYVEVEEALVSVKAYDEIYADPFDFNPIKVEGVTSTNDEYLPMISPDGEIMFITRMTTKQAKGDYAPKQIEEFTWCRRNDINSLFDKGAPLPQPFNKGTSCGGSTVSVDNKEMIVAMKNPKPKNPNNFDLFSTTYTLATNDKGEKVYIWTDLVDLGSNVNTDSNWESQPSLSGDGKTLFFVTVRPENLADSNGPTHDIYMSKRNGDGSWGPSRPLPSTINTTGHEKAPFMHSDSHTLYFASSGHVGVGGLDIFYCQMNEDGSFSKPKNFGVPVNTEGDEIGIVVTADGEVAYFGARNFKGSKGYDVFQFAMPEKAKPEKVMILKGEVKDDKGEPVKDAKVVLNYTESNTNEEVKVHQDDGKFAAIVRVQKNENITLNVKGADLAFNSRVVARKDELKPAVAKLEVTAPTVEANKAFVINDIKYATASATLQESSTIILNDFALYLKENEGMLVEIRGHTDDIGDAGKNKALSAERAFEVLNFLVSAGVSAKQLTYQGFGEEKPIAENTTDEGRAKNRRTEFFIKKLK
jgi:outer membrane protein OmpA-like peptidoglycan-associated protein/tetratricopeptide (TPR) repeat protein